MALLLSRQVLQWPDGLGILIAVTTVVARLSVGGAKLIAAESQILDVARLLTRFRDTTRILTTRYAGIATLAIAVLVGLKVPASRPL